jgi:Coenzyme PQQ synthesis protein D (PqqD)
MVEIHPSASYVRHSQRLASGSEPEGLLQRLVREEAVNPPDAPQRIWELLETPQTVETICRVLRNEFDLPPGACTEEVKIVLSQLYREDLIELSPDT